jgi:hypothetical protein
MSESENILRNCGTEAAVSIASAKVLRSYSVGIAQNLKVKNRHGSRFFTPLGVSYRQKLPCFITGFDIF